MLYFLDAQYNVKGAPNENFAREVMELFTMGVGNYTEQRRPRVRARVHRVVLRRPHVQGRSGQARRRLENVPRPAPAISTAWTCSKIIFEQPVTAEFLAAKIYRFLVRDELSPALQRQARHGAARRRLRGQAAADG